MKKLLVFILIAMVACEVAEETSILKAIAGALEKLFNLLDGKGIITKMRNMIRKKAVELCLKYAGPLSMYCNAIYDII